MLFDEEMMLLAIEEAKKAAEIGEVPVGAVIVDETGEIIATGHNMRETENCPTAHAEIVAIEKAALVKKSWRLTGCTLYVTLEPCPMCAGAVLNARVGKVFFGARDRNFGACGGILNIFEENFGYHPQLVGGILEKECSDILSNFFHKLR